MNLRQLRLWHWRCFKRSRELEEFYIACSNKKRYEQHKEKSNFHIQAVQLLNDAFELGDTTERDEQNERDRLLAAPNQEKNHGRARRSLDQMQEGHGDLFSEVEQLELF